ncbi:chemoreceptor glutamine deamidase CheD [Algiphilus sp. NNCM1]|uniref:chemoreceptor glutamine deamidase CheD n=1 Tax=Algiphilus sp. TaxID=1872431 RepID=UPI001CA77DAB|nr:chemoreceptor glutamine deamidase CheD [Algiphilus sp.]MBY8966166.1 chemoreceptor glutamine deamidase CheD [Algiphilus acroporae]MCI5061498.1 chemoreceptor glutamine deamidase CheD [Algiphilus sp.]MCI5103841.1 chemoreceptor glutamine deamidase CheD [Algiphilus sp.]
MNALATVDGYIDTRLDARVIKILPGEHQALKARSRSGQPVLATTLGSCVAACIYEESDAGIGGMNHFLLPSGDQASGRYGVYAMELLINDVLKLGARRDRLRAKVFGGGAVLAAVTSIDIGRQNATFVKRFLATEGIPITGEDLMGPHPRKVLFFPATSEARVRRLPLAHSLELADAEARYRERVAQYQKPRVELFS